MKYQQVLGMTLESTRNSVWKKKSSIAFFHIWILVPMRDRHAQTIPFDSQHSWELVRPSSTFSPIQTVGDSSALFLPVFSLSFSMARSAFFLQHLQALPSLLGLRQGHRGTTSP